MTKDHSPQAILNQYFGYHQFRGFQEEIINSVLSGHDTLAILPTGGGKSLCYQIPGLILGGQTLVISPLISLMEDQVSALTKRNLAATYLSSSLPKTELQHRLHHLKDYQFIYLTPERLASQAWIEQTQELEIKLIAVDEAHCISEWGHDFRPPYLAIGKYLTHLPQRPPIVALTATATPATKNEIIHRLKLHQPQIFIAPTRRTNLILNVEAFHLEFAQIFHLLLLIKAHSGQPGIIYAQTRAKTEYLAQLFKHYFPTLKVKAYHAGLSCSERTTIQNQFLSNQLQIIVATSAFGMGVDKADLRFVIHFGIPPSIENYYQEVGRAGRDQQPATCHLLHKSADWQLAHELVCKSSDDKTFNQKTAKKHQLRQLHQFLTHQHCLHDQLDTNFSGKALPAVTKNCQSCQFCLNSTLKITGGVREQFLKLINWRQQQADHLHRPSHSIITDQTLALIAITQPTTKAQLLKIPGIGQGFVDQWADDIIHLI